MTKKVEDLIVAENRKLSDEFYVLGLLSGSSLEHILPGQFVQLRVDGSPSTFLRRPFSVYDVDYKTNIIWLLYQVVGKGTDVMSFLAKGNSVSVVFPLGNSFTMPQKGERILMVGGGVGIAPFLYFAKEIKDIGCKTEFLFGFRNKERIIKSDQFREYGELHITTEDGSVGEKGFVTAHSVLNRNKYDRIYCCGPDPMMKAVAGYARTKNIFCEVSLENLMACGFGICLCCIVETNRGNICTCTEGPVFNINELKW